MAGPTGQLARNYPTFAEVQSVVVAAVETEAASALWALAVVGSAVVAVVVAEGGTESGDSCSRPGP